MGNPVGIAIKYPASFLSDLKTGNCHVWFIRPTVNIPRAQEEFLQSTFLPGRRSRSLMCFLASKYTGKPPNELEVDIAIGGKPYFADAPELGVSVSHTLDYVAIAFVYDSQVGIDLESKSRNVNASGVARRYFHQTEIRQLELMSGAARDREFLRFWVLKEAAVKVRGRGLASDLCKAVTRRSEMGGHWKIGSAEFECSAREFEFEGLIGAVAVPDRRAELRISFYAPTAL